MKRAGLLIAALLSGVALGATATGATAPRHEAKAQQGKKGSSVKHHRRARHHGRCLRKRHHRCVAWAHPAPHRHSTTTTKSGSGTGAGGGGGGGSGGTSTGGSGSGGSGAGSTTGVTTAPSTTTTTPPPTLYSRTLVDVNDQNGYSMYPSHTQLAAGNVQFNVDNFGQDPHTFAIEDASGTVIADANGSTDPTNLPAGSSGTQVNYNLPAGTYTMLCTLYDHANRGMKFTFTVS